MSIDNQKFAVALHMWNLKESDSFITMKFYDSVSLADAIGCAVMNALNEYPRCAIQGVVTAKIEN